MIERRVFLAGLGVFPLAAQPPKKELPKEPPKSDSILIRILKLTGISATSRGLKAVESISGDIWTVDTGGKAQERITSSGGYSSPIFAPDDRRLLAIYERMLVWVSRNSHATEKAEYSLPGVVRLIGFERKAPTKPRVVLVTRETIGLFSPWDGNFETLGGAEQAKEALSLFTSGALEFGGTLLKADPNNHGLTLQRPHQDPVELIRPTQAIIADPALSHDGSTVAYIRAKPG